MGWNSGQVMLRKEGGVWRQLPNREEHASQFFTFREIEKIDRFLKEHDLETDTRPIVDGKRNQKRKKGGEMAC